MRTVIQQDFKNALEEVDLLISPVTPTAAYKIGKCILIDVMFFGQTYKVTFCTVPKTVFRLP